MVMKARGATILSILNKAGIDINSVKAHNLPDNRRIYEKFFKESDIRPGIFYPKLNLIEKADAKYAVGTDNSDRADRTEPDGTYEYGTYEYGSDESGTSYRSRAD